jgi:hypothetical protein
MPPKCFPPHQLCRDRHPGQNSYTDRQLINNAIPLHLTTGICQHPFEEWDRLTVPNQTWIALRSLIQEVFQRQLNATAPTAGYHGYAPAQPFQQNAFGILGNDADGDDDEESITNTVATQVAVLTCQSQLTQYHCEYQSTSRPTDGAQRCTECHK